MRWVSLAAPVALAALLIGPVLATALPAWLGRGGVSALPAALWWHSALVAAVAVLTALVVGLALAAWAVHIWSAPLRWAVVLGGAFPLAVPMYLHGMAAWQVAVALGLYTERHTTGPWTDLLVVGFVQGLRLSACVLLLTVVGWQTLHARWLEAGLVVAPQRWVRRHLLMPLLAPFVGLGALLAAVLSLTDVAVPLLFQVHSVVALRLWDAHYRGLDPVGAWQAMLGPALLLLGAVALLFPALWRRAAPLLNARRDPALIPRGQWLRLGHWAAGLAALVAVNGSLIQLLRQVTDARALVETFRANASAIGASLETALGGAAVALLAGVALAHGWRRGVSALLMTLAAAVLAVPGFLWAAAAVAWWNQPGWRGTIFDTGLVRWFALGGRLTVLPALILGLALARQSRTQREAARVAGLGRGRTWLAVTWPPLRRPAWAAFALSALAICGDLDAALLLDMPGRTTLVVALCNRLHISPRSPEVAMMAVVILATVTVLLAVPLLVGVLLARLRRLGS